MSQMIERIARAMATADSGGDYWDEKSEDGDGYGYVGKNEYRTMARAAIEAMREPTEAMELAFWRAHHAGKSGKQSFSAMYDEALK